jgi:hypothetical protein
MRTPRSWLALACGAGLLILASAGEAVAEERSNPMTIKIAAGGVTYIAGHGTGASLAYGHGFSPRWGVDFESTYLYASSRESGMLFSLNLVRLYGKQQEEVRPYLLFGLGFFGGSGNWSGDAGLSPTVGAGMRIFLGKRLFLAPEARLGYIPVSRLSLALGCSL